VAHACGDTGKDTALEAGSASDASDSTPREQTPGDTFYVSTALCLSRQDNIPPHRACSTGAASSSFSRRFGHSPKSANGKDDDALSRVMALALEQLKSIKRLLAKPFLVKFIFNPEYSCVV